MGKTQELGAFRMRPRGARGGPGMPGSRWVTRALSGRLHRIVAAASRLASPPWPKQSGAWWSGRAGLVDLEASGSLTCHRSLCGFRPSWLSRGTLACFPQHSFFLFLAILCYKDGKLDRIFNQCRYSLPPPPNFRCSGAS